jgi:hypothetical protein
MYQKNVGRFRGSGRWPKLCSAHKDERVVDATPQDHWKVATFMAGLRASDLNVPTVCDGSRSGAHEPMSLDQIRSSVILRLWPNPKEWPAIATHNRKMGPST